MEVALVLLPTWHRAEGSVDFERVNVLVKKGYLEREYSAEDRRMIHVCLTEKGETANRKYLDFVRNMLYEVSSDLDEDTADKMIETLLRLSDYLDRAQEEA